MGAITVSSDILLLTIDLQTGNMALDVKILLLIRRKFGKTVETDNDFYELIARIKEVSGEELSLNTLKRLFGIIPGTSNPRTVTRNILARYLGFDSWNLLTESLNDNDPASRFGDKDGVIYSSDLEAGTAVSFNFGNGKDIVLEYIGDRQFKVVSVSNSKIRKGDILLISRMAELDKFLADGVVRDGRIIGRYNSDHKIMSLRVSKSSMQSL